MSVVAPVVIEADEPRFVLDRRTLPCGLEVLVHPDHSAPQCCVSVWYRVGSSDEQPDRTGFAHLFEHLFKSPPSRLGGRHHYDVLKRAGATQANASTSADRTAYYEVVPAHQLELALWLESNRMGYFADDFDEARLIAQQAVVRSERRQRYENVPYGAERFAVGRALYAEGHPLRHLTIGQHDDIQAATHADVLAFYRTWYVPANATLVIAGDVPANIDALVDRYFGSFPVSMRPTRPCPAVRTPVATRAQVGDPFAALRRLHRVWLAPRALDEDDPELDLLAMSWSAVGPGVLWRSLVYERQLAQRVSAWTINGRLGGELHITIDLRTGADPEEVRAILDDGCARSIDPRAVERAVTRREAQTIWSLGSLTRRVGMIQRGMLYGDDPNTMALELRRYRAATPASVAAACARWLAPAAMIEIETIPQPA